MLYTVIDLETSGLSKTTDNILEVGYLNVDSESLDIVSKGEFYFYRPDWEIGATHIHGLTRADLQPEQNNFYLNIIRLFTLVQGANLVGKNSVDFDLPLIMSFLRRYAPELMCAEVSSHTDMQDVYTPIFKAEWFKKYQEKTRKRGKLGELVEMIGYSDSQIEADFKIACPNSKRQKAHGALYDAYMTLLLLRDAKKNGYI